MPLREEDLGKLTDDNPDRSEGKADRVIDLLQQRYAQERVKEKYNRFMKRYGQVPTSLAVKTSVWPTGRTH